MSTDVSLPEDTGAATGWLFTPPSLDRSTDTPDATHRLEPIG